MPEITLADEFGRAIVATIRSQGFRSAIEIGSWDGTGSTAVLIEALRHAERPSLVCLEAKPERHEQLRKTVAAVPWVTPICASSVSWREVTPRTFGDVWNCYHNRLVYLRDQVKGWWDEFAVDMDDTVSGYLEQHPEERYDVALIDGCEFTGWDEFRLLRNRVRCLILDDVFHAYKCARAHDTLMHDPQWRLVWASAFVRNGASIWLRTG